MTTKSEERHIVATIIAKPGLREEVKALLLDLIQPARDEPGCLYYDLYQEEKAPDTFTIVDGWASAQAVEDHVAHPNVIAITAKITPFLVSSTHRISLRVSDPS